VNRQLGCCLLLCGLASQLSAADYTPTASYEVRELRGFRLRIHPTAIEHADDLATCLEELDAQFKNIQRVVPDKPLEKLRDVPFWIEWQVRPRGAAEVHVSAGWLKDNGYNPDKLYAVEINNCRNFVDWSRTTQPWMVLHELTHAYHHRVLGSKHAALKAAYDQAAEGKIYTEVKHVNGRIERAYALTNVDEYFAELSEAYFGKNDFFPFVTAELEQHDPIGYRTLRDIWGVPVDRPLTP
jgi:hypothetical protein